MKREKAPNQSVGCQNIWCCGNHMDHKFDCFPHNIQIWWTIQYRYHVIYSLCGDMVDCIFGASHTLSQGEKRWPIEQKNTSVKSNKLPIDKVGKWDIIGYCKTELPYQERWRERPCEARQPAMRKVLNPAAEYRKMRVREIQTLRCCGAFFSPS